MNNHTIAALLVVSSLQAPGLVAQTGSAAPSVSDRFVDPVNGLSLDQAITRALAAEPSLQAARTAVDAARGRQLQAGSRKNPSVSAELRREPAGTDSQTMLSVDWPLDLFRRRGRVAVAEREAGAVALSVADRERLLASEVRARYGDALVAVRDLMLLEELVDAARRQLDLLRARVDEGASPPLDRDLAQVEARRFDAERLLQLGRAEQAMIDLKRVLGVAPAEPLRLTHTLEEVVIHERATEPPLSGASQGRPDVREAEARIAVSDAKIDRAERDGRFDVRLFGGYIRMDSGFSQFGLSLMGQPERVRGQFHYVTGGAMVTLPIFDRNHGELAAARAERAGAVATYDAARLAAEAEIAIARSLDQRASEAAQIYGQEIRTLARQNLNVVKQSYELGRRTIFEVLAEQRRYLEQERAFTDALRSAYEARTALKRALGEMR
jgi:outer membrane protein, heavy metal efflux system